MKMTLSLVSLCAVCLFLAMPASAGSNPSLLAPTGFTATVSGDAVVFDWDDVAGAAKYSVDVEATVTYTIGTTEYEAEVELSFGTSDRTDGGEMGDSDLTVPQSEIIDEILAILAGQGDIVALTVDAKARVKALNPPGKGSKSQNNPHSAYDDFDLAWAPAP